MKYLLSFTFLMVSVCAFGQQENKLSGLQEEQIKKEIIASYKKHIEDLVNLDYEEVMKFYPEDHIIFADGVEWGGYDSIDGIWKWCMNNWQVITKWELKNHQVYVFSKDAASYLVEFDNERVEPDGDTTKVTGCFSYGMKRFPDGWKAATQHVTHNYKPGYNPRIKNDSIRVMDVGIVVSDLERSLDFYSKVIGMTQVSTFHLSPDLATNAGLTDGLAVDVINLQLNDEPGAPKYKLAKIEGITGEVISDSFKPGSRYITLKVKDIKPFQLRIREYNIELINKKPVNLPGGITVLLLRDPDGAILEIIGPSPR